MVTCLFHKQVWPVLPVVLAVALLATVARAEPGQIKADGLLDEEALLVLDLDRDGTPDVLEERIGFAGFWVDNIETDAYPAGPDGFRDAGMRDLVRPDCSACAWGLQCADIEFGAGSARSPVNTGKLTIIYLPDSDAFIDPGDVVLTDDSLLYVGMDIFNGDSRRVPAGATGILDVDYHDLDFRDTERTGDICEDGVADFDGDGNPDFFGVLFDVDGDGDPQHIGRWYPLPECTPKLLSDRDYESYNLILYACSDLQSVLRGDRSELALGDYVGAILLSVGWNKTDIDLEIDFPGLAVPDDWIELFPDPRDPDLDETSEVAARGPRDLEFIIRHVDTLADEAFPETDYAVDRFRMAHAGIATLSDANGDAAGEDRLLAEWLVDIPQIEVTTQVRCAGDGTWESSVPALPGAILEFKVELEVTGNVPLHVTLHDVLETFGEATATVDPGSLKATLFRPADGPGVPVDVGNAADYGLNPVFFAPAPSGFLGGVDAGEPRHLGVLEAVDACQEPVVAGDRLELIFKVTTGASADLCDAPWLPVDVRNAVTAIGDPDHPPAPLSPPPGGGRGVSDAAGPVDTSREIAGETDDNVAYADLLCRDSELIKEVRVTPDQDRQGDWKTNLTIDHESFPLDIEYRYTVRNRGEIEEIVALSEPFFCDDVEAITDLDLVTGECAICE